jgi:RHS repeat-associated protein
LISGNVNHVTFQPNKADQFIHRYNYDADNRIINVETSPDNIVWEKDADYKYYPHGPLSRVELGNKKVQGVDYAYTLQGWLKTVNGEDVTSYENDLGRDGVLGIGTQTKDAFGYSLNYYKDDYQGIQGDSGDENFKPLQYSRNDSVGVNNSNLFNGNIKQMTTAIRKNLDELLPVQKNNYQYDQLNRISSMTSIAIEGDINNNNNSYSSNYSYDKNGNLKSLIRTIDGVNPMDELRYIYTPETNKLVILKDGGNSSIHNTDLEDQFQQLSDLIPGYSFDLNNYSTHNYVYDEIGQLIEDKTEGLKIEWRVDGKVKNVTKNNSGTETYISFEYDGLGNRIIKRVSDNVGRGSKMTYYARDAQGNVLAVYELSQNQGREGIVSNLRLKEHHIFGSSRLGLEDKELSVFVNNGIRLLAEKSKNLVEIDSKKPLSSYNINFPEGLKNNSLANSLCPEIIDGDDVPTDFYSLSFNLTKFGTWSNTLTNPTAIAINDEFNLETKFKLNPATLIGDTTIGFVEDSTNEFETFPNTTYEYSILKSEVTTSTANLINPTTPSSPCINGNKLIKNTTAVASAKVNDDVSLTNNSDATVKLESISEYVFGISYVTSTYAAPANSGAAQNAMKYHMITSTTTNPSIGKIKCYYRNSLNILTQLGNPLGYDYVVNDVVKIARNGNVISFYQNQTLLAQINEDVPVLPVTTTTRMRVQFFLGANSTFVSNPKVTNYNIESKGISVPITGSLGALVATAQYNQIYGLNIAYSAPNNSYNSIGTASGTASGKTILWKDGYIERTIKNVGGLSNINSIVGLGTSPVADLGTLYAINTLASNFNFNFGNYSATTFTINTSCSNQCLTFQENDRLRIERKANIILFQRVRNVGGIDVITVLGRASGVTTNALYLKIKFPSDSQLRNIYDLKIVNYVDPINYPNPLSSYKRSKATLLVTKSSTTGYTPKVVFEREALDFTSTTRPYKKVITTYTASSGVSTVVMNSAGMDLKFNLLATNKFNINGNNVSTIPIPNPAVTNSTTIPVLAPSKIGGVTNSSFEMCNFNYRFGSSTNNVSANFSFQSSSTSQTVLPIVSSSGLNTLQIALNTIPVKTPTNLCVPLLDQDSDGIYDIYEIDYTTPGSTILNSDTDDDGILNYLDCDDDGDGLFTQYEVSNADGDFNPLTGTILNSDLTSVTNPDSFPNFQDADDDGDGINTLYEGADPDGDGNTNTGSPSVNTDLDSLPDYLDNDDDNDTVFTFYEGVNTDGDFNPFMGSTLNTDGDLLPNYLDTDDDGDGIVTTQEGPINSFGDQVVGMGGVPSLNTDQIYNPLNPNMIADTIANYLDIDDDGDGYNTWESIEGGYGFYNYNPAGLPYTQDTDGNGDPDYLSYNDKEPAVNYPSTFDDFMSLIGDKRYELSNHLGNVLVVINDKKIPMLDHEILKAFNADIISYSDYYPFGSLLPKRFGASQDYRYGFNGKEKDDELKGEGNSIDFGARLYDSRIGRWFATDPIHQPYESPYSYVAGNPILFIDEDGNDNIVYLVLLPSAKIKLGKQGIASIKNEMQKRLKDLGLHTEVKIFDNVESKFDSRNLDKSDSFVVLGSLEEIKKEVKDSPRYKDLNDKSEGVSAIDSFQGVSGGSPGYTNPEISAQKTSQDELEAGKIEFASGVLVDLEALDENTTKYELQTNKSTSFAYFAIHGLGHNSGLGHDSRTGYLNAEYGKIEGSIGRSKNRQIDAIKTIEDVFKKANNKEFTKAIGKRLNDKKDVLPTDNYEKNKKARAKTNTGKKR